jgi:hypothetical protein
MRDFRVLWFRMKIVIVSELVLYSPKSCVLVAREILSFFIGKNLIISGKF